MKSYSSIFEFNYRTESSAEVLWVHLRGQLVYETLKATEACWEAVRAAARPSVILDLSHVSFMGSAALGSLLSLRLSLAARGCSLRISAVSVPVRQILEVTGLIRVFTIDEEPVETAA